MCVCVCVYIYIMRDPQNAFRVGGKQYYVAEDHQRPVMEHWGCLLYISQNLGGGVGWEGGEAVTVSEARGRTHLRFTEYNSDGIKLSN